MVATVDPALSFTSPAALVVSATSPSLITTFSIPANVNPVENVSLMI